MKQVPLIGFAIPIFTMLLWAGNNVVMRAAVGIIDPEAILAYRWGFATLIILPFAARSLWQYRRAIYGNLGKLASLGVLGMVLSQACAYYAARTTTATNMGIISSLGPLMTFGFSAILLGEKPGWIMAMGALLSLFGLSVLIGKGHPLQILEVGFQSGNGIMLIGTVGYALYNVLLRRWLLPIPVWPSLFVQISAATLVLVPLYLLTPTAPVTMKALPIILYSVLLISILAPILWILTIARLGANRSSLFINLLPLFTAILAMLGLGEELFFYHLAGGVLTLSGVMLAQLGRAKVRGH